MAKRRTRVKVLTGIGIAVAVLLLIVAWLWLKAEADELTSGSFASPVPRSGIVTTIDDSTLTLTGNDGSFTVTVGEQTTVRRADSTGAFQSATTAEIAVGQLATMTGELPGSPVGTIDLVDLGGVE